MDAFDFRTRVYPQLPSVSKVVHSQLFSSVPWKSNQQGTRVRKSNAPNGSCRFLRSRRLSRGRCRTSCSSCSLVKPAGTGEGGAGNSRCSPGPPEGGDGSTHTGSAGTSNSAAGTGPSSSPGPPPPAPGRRGRTTVGMRLSKRLVSLPGSSSSCESSLKRR